MPKLTWSRAAAWRIGRHHLESVRLLPGFDPYVVGASFHSGHLMPGDFRARVFRPQGWISPVRLINGFIRGVWRHEIKNSRVEVAIEPFVEPPLWVPHAQDRRPNGWPHFSVAR